MKSFKALYCKHGRFSRSLSILLASALFLSSGSFGGMTSSAAGAGQMQESIVDSLVRDNTVPGKYVIYPVPHELIYTEQILNLSGKVNIYFEAGIDEYTRQRLQVNLADNNVTASVSDTAESDGVSILVGIYQSGGAVDALAADKAVQSHFLKTDAYLLYTTQNQIIILGKDADSAYYGVTTFRQMLEQKGDGNILYGVTVTDYSDIPFRGFIEGYYGNPWTKDDRVELMKFGGDYKMNQYIYAPKDDPYHNSRWRELYPDSELPKIEALAKAGNESKCSFVFAVHPFMNKPFNFNNYDADLKTLEARYTQAIEHGVRSIAILEDDSAGATAGNIARLLNDLHAYLIKMKETYPDLKTTILYCPTDYMNNGSSQKLKTINTLVGDSINIMMTGGRVWGEVSATFGSNFRNNIASAGADGRSPYMWINWPCTDNSKQHLIMGGYTTFLHPGINPSDYQGIVLNPMQQSEPSKAAIFGNAAFSWNVWEDDKEAETIWQDAFNFIDHGTIHETYASASLRELSKHMINQNMDNRVTELQESVELAPKLAAYEGALISGSGLEAASKELTAEFKKLEAAAQVYRNTSENTRVRDQIIDWLDCWDDTLEAVEKLIDGELAYEAGAYDQVWDNYSAAQMAYERSKTHEFHYVDHTEYAEVGVQHIVPFIHTLLSDLGAKVATILDPTKVIGTYITSRTDTPSGNPSYVMDGDAATEIIYKNPNSIAEGTYIGVIYRKPITIDKVKFELGQSANPLDTFSKSKLQYTEDGTVWKDIEGAVYQNNETVIERTGLGLTAMGIRIIATEYKANTWLGIREITVNDPPQKPAEQTVIHTDTWDVYSGGGPESDLTDGNDNTYVWYQTPGNTTYKGDYIGFDLGKVSRLGKVRFVIGNTGGDKWEKYHLAYSDDKETWTTYKSYSDGTATGRDIVSEDLSGISARYVCMFHDADKYCWVKFSEISVEQKDPESTVYTNASRYETLTISDTGSVVTLKETTGMTLGPQEYIGIQLDSIKKLKSVAVDPGDAKGLVLQASVNGLEWNEIAFTGGNAFPKSRLIRLKNPTDAAVTFDLNYFRIEKEERTGIQFMETTMGIHPTYGSSDSRKNGTLKAMFDGDFTTNTEFCDYPEKDGYILYDLGQERLIRTIRAYTKEGEKNYLRDGILQVSGNQKDWTDVARIGDGQTNVEGDAQASDGWQYESGGNYYFEGSLSEPETARYLRIYFTAGYPHRFISFSEVVINGGEYVQDQVDDRFDSSVIEEKGHAPQNMTDGDLSTSYIPGAADGELIYHLDNPAVDQITIVQKDSSKAVVSARVSKASKASNMLTEDDTTWVKLGVLDKTLVTYSGLNDQYIYDIKLEWGDKIPTIYEMMVLSSTSPGEPK